MRYLIETLGACWELLMLAARSRFRLRGRYWRWRLETAFGTHDPPEGSRLAAAFHYARWVYRMKRLG